MASDMLKAVLAAEQECAQKEAEAKKQADANKQKAKQEAAAIVEKAQADAQKMLADNEKLLTLQAEKELEEAKTQARTECGKISDNARQNIGRVRKLVVELLTKP